MLWQVSPADSLCGSIAVPGSKSHTIRGVIAAFLADGVSEISAPLYSADTISALTAIKALGAVTDEKKEVWKITGSAGKFFSPATPVDLGNSGTTMRIITAISALSRGKITFDGDDSLRKRIMQGELDALTALGAKCESTNGYAPLSVSGPLSGGKAHVDGTTSQYLTALLMALPLAENDSVLDLDFLNEADYVKITLQWLNDCGIEVNYTDDLLHFEIPGRQRYKNFSKTIPADFSTAAFPLGAGVIAGKKVEILNLDFNDLQGDKKVFDYVRKMNGNITFSGNKVIVSASELTGASFDLNSTPDALPLMAVMGCYAEGETRLLNVPQARFKECDRIACMTKELRKMGAEIEELPDGMIIHGGRQLHGAFVESYHDHRIAMALTVAALKADGTVSISDGNCCEVTYPGFAADFRTLGVNISVRENGC